MQASYGFRPGPYGVQDGLQPQFDPKPEAIKSRVKLFAALTIYITLFLWIYNGWGTINWWYLGLKSNGDAWELTYAIALCYMCVVILPVEIKKYSDFFASLLFWSSVLPTLLVIARQGHPGSYSYILNGCLFTALALLVAVPKIFVMKPIEPKFQISDARLLPVITAAYVTILGLFFYTYRDILNFASIDTIYDQRSLFALTEVNIILLYVLGWLSTVLNPYFIIYGLFDRTRIWMLPLGLAGQIMIFMAFAGKSFLLALFIYFWFFWFLQKNNRLLATRVSYVYLLFVIASFASVYFSDGAMEGVWGNVSALIFMRGLALPGALTGVYAEFFSFSPLTYFSQMNIVNRFVEYPYSEALGKVIGRYLSGGSEGMNANASMWATDGLSSIGPLGIIVVGLIISILLIFANRLVPHAKLPFAAMLSTTFIMNIGESGFFTNMITGGGFILVFLVAFGAPVQRARKSRRVPHSRRNMVYR
jgi:hypothetical protein